MATGAHVSDDDLELYALDRLAEPELGRVEEHLLVRGRRRRCVDEERRFAAATRSALWRLQNVAFDENNQTKGGAIRLHVTQAADGSLRATIAGQQFAGARRFTSVAQANNAVLEMFRQMFPGHECDERCG